jgi:hypothetical protein
MPFSSTTRHTVTEFRRKILRLSSGNYKDSEYPEDVAALIP